MDEMINQLINRVSTKDLCAPAPNDIELELAFKAAMAAPDHANLKPLRFKIIRGEENLKKYADYCIDIRQKSANPLDETRLQALEGWFRKVPLFVLIACHIDYQNTKVPEEERLISASCSVMNFINVIQSLGYGVFWSTGLSTYIDEYQTGIGFNSLDYRYMGCLCIGTPSKELPKKVRDDYRKYVVEWDGKFES